MGLILGLVLILPIPLIPLLISWSLLTYRPPLIRNLQLTWILHLAWVLVPPRALMHRLLLS